jgi:pimeloyl-ACP methyl ester carboxylesterase
MGVIRQVGKREGIALASKPLHTLVLLPGLDGTGRMFRGLSDALPSTPIIVRYPGSAGTLDDHVDQALSKMPSDDALVLVAESFSGPIAIKLASRLAPRIRTLILAATFATSPSRMLSILGPSMLDKLLSVPMPDLAIRSLLLGQSAPPPLIEDLRTSIREAGVETLANRLGLLAHLDVTEELSLIDVPVCFIQAMHDRLVPPRAIVPFEKHTRNLTIRAIDGPHFILQARPRESARVILEFLSDQKTGHRGSS